METLMVLVPCTQDLDAKMMAAPDRATRILLRKNFNQSVLDDIKQFANDKGLSVEVDFTHSGTNISGVFFACTDVFQSALKQAALPHVGNFMKDGPLLSDPSRPKAP